jgi:hypothetical protein
MEKNIKLAFYKNLISALKDIETASNESEYKTDSRVFNMAKNLGFSHLKESSQRYIAGIIETACRNTLYHFQTHADFLAVPRLLNEQIIANDMKALVKEVTDTNWQITLLKRAQQKANSLEQPHYLTKVGFFAAGALAIGATAIIATKGIRLS